MSSHIYSNRLTYMFTIPIDYVINIYYYQLVSNPKMNFKKIDNIFDIASKLEIRFNAENVIRLQARSMPKTTKSLFL